MSADFDNKPGYQKTKLGLIPVEWKLSSVDQLAKVVDSLHKTPVFSDSGFPMVRVGDINKSRLNLNECLRVSEEIFSQFNKNHEPRNGDILMTRVGSFGKSIRVDTDERFCIGQNTVVITEVEDSNFLYYMLNAPVVQKSMILATNGSSQPSLSLKDIRNLKIPLPPLPEQRKIAEILSTWDEAIETLEKLIAAKEKLKKGLMQQLLTGKKRLPGFEGEWEKVKMGDLFNNKADKSHNGELPVLSATQEDGIVFRDQVGINIKYDPKSLGTYKLVEPGDFVISLRSFQGGIEYSDIKGIVSPAYTILASKTPLADNFFKHLFKSQEFINRLDAMVFGIRDGKQISYKDFKDLKYSIPSVEEQKAIGKFLDLADKEIETLAIKSALVQKQKKGLMQQLLTGKTRVKV